MTNVIEEQALRELVPVGAVFEHYKGKQYKVLSVGRHSEDLELHVVYQGLYDDETFGHHPIWIRPLRMFLETVTIDGREVPRFALCGKL